MKYYLGIDGGGTKTAFVCLNQNKEEMCRFSSSTCHVLQVSKEDAISILKEGLDRTLREIHFTSEDSIVICAGLAGYGKDKNLRERIESICSIAFYPYPYCIYNDAEIALEGALDGNDGILVIAGTGAIAYTKKDSQYKRCGGWGDFLGDEGSGYWIAKKLLTEYTQQVDGRSQRTNVVPTVKSYLNLENDYDLISYLAKDDNKNRTKIASLSKLACSLALEEDEAALKIFDKAAYELSRLILTLANEFDGRCTVSYIGGVWKAEKLIFTPLKSYLSDKINITSPKYDPAFGACLIAFRKFK